MAYKFILHFPSGNSEEDDEIYATREEAEVAALDALNSCETGAEILHDSNPGDYEYDGETYRSPDYEIIEVW